MDSLTDCTIDEEDSISKISTWVANYLTAERVTIQTQMTSYHESLIPLLERDLRKCINDCQRNTELREPRTPRTPASANSTLVTDNAEKNAQGDSNHTNVFFSSGQISREPTKTTDYSGGRKVNSLPAAQGPVNGQRKNVKSPETAWSFTRSDDMKPRMERDITVQQWIGDTIVGYRETIMRHGHCRAYVEHPLFEAFFVFLILVNTLVSALQAQYKGFDMGKTINYPGMTTSAADTWPGAIDVFDVSEYVFAALYTCELLVKILGLRFDFVKDPWNMFDLLLVVLWYCIEFGHVGSFIDPMMLRLCRLARLMRLVRHVGWFQAFDSLHMLLSAITASFPVLVWSVMLIFTLLVIFSLFMHGLLSDFMEGKAKGPGNLTTQQELEQRRNIYKYFGTFYRALISMFEISFASHVPVCRAVMENVDERYALFFVCYKCIIGLSVMKVITGVFLHETFKVCSEDDELMIIQKRRTVREHLRKMAILFEKVDENGDGTISWEEFAQVMTDEWLRVWLSAMDVDVSQVERLWSLMGAGRGTLTAEELVKGVSWLKGPARSIDLNYVSREVDQMRVSVEQLCISLNKKYAVDDAVIGVENNLQGMLSSAEAFSDPEVSAAGADLEGMLSSAEAFSDHEFSAAGPDLEPRAQVPLRNQAHCESEEARHDSDALNLRAAFRGVQSERTSVLKASKEKRKKPDRI